VACQRLIDAHLAQPSEGRDAALQTLRSAFRSVRAAAEEIIGINQEAMVRKSAQAADNARVAVEQTGATACLSFLLASAITSMTISRTLGPLWLLRRTVSRVGEGDFETRILVSGNDELAQLAVSVNIMAEHLQQYRASSQGKLTLAQHASQAAIDSLPDPVIVFDTEGTVVLTNDAAKGLLWRDVTGHTGHSLTTLDPALLTALERVRDHVLSGQGAFTPKGFEEAVHLESPDAGQRSFLARATAVRSSGGGMAGATVTLQDVTVLRLAYDLRSDLVATVAHEFRTPLTSIRLATHMCLEGAAGVVSEKQADLLYAAREECERLQSIVDQLLDLARIQGGRVELKRERVAPDGLVSEALATQEVAARERRVNLRSFVLPGLPEVVVDRERTQLIFSNLLTNAVRHSPPGSSVSVVASGRSDDAFLRFEISDAAGGIPTEFQAVLFDRFRQLPGGHGAVGLGLSIAKEIVEAHGGRIGVQSVEGQGSTFWFTLPTLARPDAAIA
jgi:NtrC-family two-component system sensor histidine kinase KinB